MRHPKHPSPRKLDRAGQTIIEVLIAIALAGIMLPTLATAMAASREGKAQEAQRLQASALLREADEATRSAREKGWTGFAVNGTYKPALVANAWSLTAGAETINGFTRQIVIADAQRDATGAIVDSGGTADPSTKKITSTVSWSTPFPSSVSNDSYYHRYAGNTTWTQTSQADFNGGTTSGTATANVSGGEVTLTPSPVYNWASIFEASSLDINGTEDQLDVKYDNGYAYLADSNILRIVNVTNPAAPVLSGSYTAADVINAIDVEGNYAYLATAATNAEVTVVNITTKTAPTLADTLDLTSTSDATGIVVDAGYAYVTRALSATAGANEFNVVNIATPTNITLTGSLNMTAAANDAFAVGNYVALATANTAAELTIINVTTKTAPTQAGVYNSAGTAVANAVYVVGTTVYLAEATNAAGAELFVLNATNPAAVTLIGSYEANGTLNDVVVSNNTAYLATAITGAQLRIVNITTPTAISVLSNYNFGSVVSGLDFNGVNIFLATASNTEELDIVGANISGYTYPASGTFESSSFAPAAAVGYNYLTYTSTEPANTDVRFQVATNNDNATWNYVGPDGTAATFYGAAGAIPLSVVNARYMRYKATLTTTVSTTTPTLSDVTVNYSP